MLSHCLLASITFDEKSAIISNQGPPVYIKSCFLTPPTTGVGEDAGKKEPSYTVGGNVD
jgi:hypothetical protein